MPTTIPLNDRSPSRSKSGCGTPDSVVGAYTVAFGISLLNVFSAFLFFGPASRHLSHARIWPRIPAGICMILYAVIAFTLNLGVAHYREVSGDLIGEAGIEVVSRMTAAPFDLQDAESWLLFGIGLLFSVIAFYEGRTYDDAYPGYGRRDRSVREAFEEHLNAKSDASNELDDIRENALDGIRRIAHEARKQPEELWRIVDDCRRRIAEFDGYAEQLQKVGETLIEEYREANRTARSDGAHPVAHRTPWRLPLPGIERSLPDSGAASTTPEKLDDDYRTATDRLHDCCEAVRASVIGATGPSAGSITSSTPVATEPGHRKTNEDRQAT